MRVLTGVTAIILALSTSAAMAGGTQDWAPGAAAMMDRMLAPHAGAPVKGPIPVTDPCPKSWGCGSPRGAEAAGHFNPGLPYGAMRAAPLRRP